MKKINMLIFAYICLINFALRSAEAKIEVEEKPDFIQVNSVDGKKYYVPTLSHSQSLREYINIVTENLLEEIKKLKEETSKLQKDITQLKEIREA